MWNRLVNVSPCYIVEADDIICISNSLLSAQKYKQMFTEWLTKSHTSGKYKMNAIPQNQVDSWKTHQVSILML